MATHKGYIASDEEGAKELKAPTMTRSRSQLSSAYAPGAFFTFEGGLGACISISDQSANPDTANISEETKVQIVLRLREAWQSWFQRAYAINAAGRTIDPRQCIDGALLRGAMVDPLSSDRLEFVNPLHMGYTPVPLTFVCNTCGMFRSYDRPSEMAQDSGNFVPSKCPNPKKKGKCQWRQLDVVFVHWSGEWQAATPGMWEWSSRTSEAYLSGERCQNCESKDFLLKTESPRIGEWAFACASCGQTARPSWLQNDRFTTEIFKDVSRPPRERRMEPISYRASSAFYAQWEQFVVFDANDQGLLSYLHEGNEAELGNFIATKYGFGGALPTPEEMRDILERGGQKSEWDTYASWQMIRDKEKGSAVAQMADTEMRKLVRRWTDSEPPLIPVRSELPAALAALMTRRQEFGSRFDPFVLSVEHESLMRSKITRTTELGVRAPFVRFYRLDQDMAPKDVAKKTVQESKTLELMGKLAFAELGLIREFELCRFTHGYSRVSDLPVVKRHDIDMPVRLRLFNPLGNRKWPIYVVTQANEAIYVSLDPKAVYAWLSALHVPDLPDWDPSGNIALGGCLLETAEPFGRYFNLLTIGEATTYRYIYTLLHSYAHLLMKAVAEFSGLDLGSLGEYVFPADLSFVIYRNGVTMDLGNLSSLWRNENNRFLAHLLEPASHRCNSGSLCDARGGACPDCIMVPETSCIAGNHLLSRAVLRGGVAPREDLTNKGQRIPGFLEMVNSGSSAPA